MGRATALFVPSQGVLGRGQKVKYHEISITTSISKMSIPNFVCVRTNKRYQPNRTEFHSVAWVMLQEWDLENEKKSRSGNFIFSQGNLEKMYKSQGS